MVNNDYADFAALWLATAELYPGKAPTDQAVELAFSALEGHSLEDIRQGLSAHVRDPDVGQYPPKPADIVRRLSGSGSDHSSAAWAKVEKSMRSVGQYQSVAFDDPIIHAAIVDLGGWVRLCNTLEDDLPFVGQRFAKRYDAYRRQGGPKEFHGWLPGIAEGENRANGWVSYIPDPCLIGEAQAAQQLIESGSQGGGNVAIQWPGVGNVSQQAISDQSGADQRDADSG